MNMLDVVTTRRPKKGSKEARAIVAMLGRMYKSYHASMGRVPEGRGWYEAWVNHDIELAVAFYAARAMLTSPQVNSYRQED